MRETNQNQSILRGEVSTDLLFDVLADRCRRRLLVALLDHNPQKDGPQKPRNVAFDDEELEQLEVAMTHSHLPKLEEAGFIDWNQEAGLVRKGPRFGDVKPLLELISNHADELPDDWL